MKQTVLQLKQKVRARVLEAITHQVKGQLGGGNVEECLERIRNHHP